MLTGEKEVRWAQGLGRLLLLLVAAWLAAAQVSASVPSLATLPAGLEPVPAQPLEFQRISLEQGLSQSSVYAIVQDSQGFLWFGTEDGLNKYDGYGFTIYRHTPGQADSLSHNMIWTIHQDRDGALWIGTDGGGLNRFDPITGQVSRYQAAEGLSNPHVRAIHQDREGILWIGSNGGGLDRLDPAKGEFRHYFHDSADPATLPGMNVTALHEDREGMLWVGTDGGGLGRLDRATGKFVNYQHDPKDSHSLSSNAVWALYEDQEGQLWVGTDGGGLDRFESASGRFVHYRHDPDDPGSLGHDTVSAIYQDRAGRLWIGTYGGGLDLFQAEEAQGPGSGRFIHYRNALDDPHSLSNDSIRSIYEDRAGVLWIGTRGGGLDKVNPRVWSFVHYRAQPGVIDSLSNNLVWALYEDGQGVLWVGTNGGGLDRFDRATGRVAHFQHDANDPGSIGSNVVKAIYEDRAGALWLGLDGGQVDRFDRDTGHFAHYQLGTNDPAQTFHQDRTGRLWVGTFGTGLYWLDETADRFVYYRRDFCTQNCLSAEYVRDIYEDQKGVLWIATQGGGLNRFDPEKKAFAAYLHQDANPPSLSNNTLMSIHPGPASVLWIGTFGGGLNRFDLESETFTHYREADGLANDVVYGVLQDSQGYLWLSTNQGLSRFDPRTETFENYDASDGLQSNEFNSGAYFQSSQGEMFFGGINGFNTFFPEQVQENREPPPVVITAFAKFNETVRTDLPAGTQIRLSYRENFVSFEFAALDYTAPEQNQYAYRLEGLDPDWVYAGTRRHADYPGLKPGDYVFRVKGSNSDGFWNETGTALSLIITPPFWQTWWFRGSALVVLLGGAVVAYRLRVRSIEARNRHLAFLVEERTAELQRESEQRLKTEEALRQSETERAVFQAVAAERSRLARDLHDAVSQTLFSASLIAEALPQSWDRDKAEGRQLLQELRHLTQGALAEMRSLLLELRPAALVEAELGDLLGQLAEAARAREGLPIDVCVQGQGRLPAEVHIAFYRIAQEALNNVVKHARAGRVSVDLQYTTLPPVPGQPGGGEQRLNDPAAIQADLSVSDDGRGFDPATIAPDCLGLGIMRERAESVGARLTVESQAGSGTKVRVVWPNGLGPAAEADDD